MPNSQTNSRSPPRTVRRDVDRLRDLGYPVDATVGVGGGYRLGAGAEMPPRYSSMTKKCSRWHFHCSPERPALWSHRRGFDARAGEAAADHAVEAATPSGVAVDRCRATRAAASAVDASVLSAIASVCHNHERLRFDYSTHDGTQSRREVEPYRLVRSGVRWYLVAWDLAREDWRSFRVDRMEPKIPHRPTIRAAGTTRRWCSRLRFPRCRSGLFLHARNRSTACTHRADSTDGQRTVGDRWSPPTKGVAS